MLHTSRPRMFGCVGVINVLCVVKPPIEGPTDFYVTNACSCVVCGRLSHNKGQTYKYRKAVTIIVGRLQKWSSVTSQLIDNTAVAARWEADLQICDHDFFSMKVPRKTQCSICWFGCIPAPIQETGQSRHFWVDRFKIHLAVTIKRVLSPAVDVCNMKEPMQFSHDRQSGANVTTHPP